MGEIVFVHHFIMFELQCSQHLYSRHHIVLYIKMTGKEWIKTDYCLLLFKYSFCLGSYVSLLRVLLNLLRYISRTRCSFFSKLYVFYEKYYCIVITSYAAFLTNINITDKPKHVSIYRSVARIINCRSLAKTILPPSMVTSILICLFP